MGSNLTISTWIFCDSIAQESVFPNSGYKRSSSKKFQEVYWKCCFNFFYTSLRYNQMYRHVLFTNTSLIPVIDGFDLSKWFKENGVEIVVLPFSFEPPINFHNYYRNTFFRFDIIKYFVEENNNDMGYVLVDSDCVWSKSANYIADEINKEGYLFYEICYPPNWDIFGLTRSEYKAIFFEYGAYYSDQSLPKHFGAEFIGARLDIMSNIFNEFKDVWSKSLARLESGQKKFNTEEHFFSYIFDKLGINEDNANKYVWRINTNPFSLRKHPKFHTWILGREVWHLPLEKDFGLVRLFNFFVTTSDTELKNMNEVEFRNCLTKAIGLPSPNMKQWIQNVLKKLKMKLVVFLGKSKNAKVS